jgi:hypothetical protein
MGLSDAGPPRAGKKPRGHAKPDPARSLLLHGFEGTPATSSPTSRKPGTARSGGQERTGMNSFLL